MAGRLSSIAPSLGHVKQAAAADTLPSCGGPRGCGLAQATPKPPPSHPQAKRERGEILSWIVLDIIIGARAQKPVFPVQIAHFARDFLPYKYEGFFLTSTNVEGYWISLQVRRYFLTSTKLLLNFRPARALGKRGWIPAHARLTRRVGRDGRGGPVRPLALIDPTDRV